MSRGLLGLGRPFVTFLAAETVSAAGTMVTVIALPLVAINHLHAGTFAIGGLEAVQWIPALALGLLLGALVDRNQERCRAILITANIGRALVLGFIPVVAALDALTLPVLLASALLLGVFTALFQSAYAPYLRQLVSTAQFSAANASMQAGRSAARIVGPSVGGALVALIGAVDTLLVTAVSYLVCSVAFLTIVRRFAPPASSPRQRITKEIGEGLHVLRTSPTLTWIAGGAATANLALTAIGALEIVFLVRNVSLSSDLIGALMTIGGVGGLTAALISRRLNSRYGLGKVATFAFLATAPTALLLPATHGGVSVVLFAIGSFAISFGISLGSVALMTLRLQYTPQHLQGRVGAVSQVLTAATIPLGALLGGAAGEYLGTRTALVVLAACYIAFSIVFARSPVRRSGMETARDSAAERGRIGRRGSRSRPT